MLIFSLQFSNTQHTTFLHVYTSYTHVYTCKIHIFHTTFCALCISLTFFIGPKFIKNQAFILSPRIGLFTFFNLYIVSLPTTSSRTIISHQKMKNRRQNCVKTCVKHHKKAKFTVFFPKIHNSYTHI